MNFKKTISINFNYFILLTDVKFSSHFSMHFFLSLVNWSFSSARFQPEWINFESNAKHRIKKHTECYQSNRLYACQSEMQSSKCANCELFYENAFKKLCFFWLFSPQSFIWSCSMFFVAWLTGGWFFFARAKIVYKLARELEKCSL